MSSAGKFEIIVSTPYPAWCHLFVDGAEVARFHHRDLADLEHATKQAMKEARHALGDDRDEV